MSREVGLSFEGREHSGIEDARNTAKLVVRMFQSGCPLNITATKDENSSTLANTAHRYFDYECKLGDIKFTSGSIPPTKMKSPRKENPSGSISSLTRARG